MASLMDASHACFADSDVACSTHCLRGVMREKQNWRSIASAGSACDGDGLVTRVVNVMYVQRERGE